MDCEYGGRLLRLSLDVYAERLPNENDETNQRQESACWQGEKEKGEL